MTTYTHCSTTNDLDVPIRYTAHDHVAAYTRLLKEAEWQAAQAQTDHERLTWLLWKDNAERGLLRWSGIVARQAVQS